MVSRGKVNILDKLVAYCNFLPGSIFSFKPVFAGPMLRPKEPVVGNLALASGSKFLQALAAAGGAGGAGAGGAGAGAGAAAAAGAQQRRQE